MSQLKDMQKEAEGREGGREKGREETVGRSLELGSDCVFQNQNVTSFVQRIKTIDCLWPPLGPQFLHIYKYRWYTGAGWLGPL